MFVDITGTDREHELPLWEPIVVTRTAIEQEVERLADLPAPEDGRRESLVTHPRATAPGLGLAPGIQVTLSVLLPGERTRPIRHNSTQVNFCIGGTGHTVVAGRKIDFSMYDVWNHPSFVGYWHVNDGHDLQVRLTYSNAALLEKLAVHLVEDNPAEQPVRPPPIAARGEGAMLSVFPLRDGRAQLMPYELLINPPAVESAPLHWPWAEVKAHLDELVALGSSYRGRRLYVLYNPATGRSNGTTPSFFATMTIRPPDIIDRPHRHVSAAINYYFKGHGFSTVAGKRYDWGPGDLMLSAPGWAVHNHASGDEPVYELTVQDQPLNILMESLLWQEDLTQSARVLGAQSGFTTNRNGESRC